MLSNAQEKIKIKWGEVSKEDLAMQVYTPDSLAEAVILEKIGKLRFDRRGQKFVYLLNVHQRIKILSEAGFDFADISIRYFHLERKEKVRNLKAQIIQPDGTIEELSKDKFFSEKTNKYWGKKTFTFPNVQVGSILEFKYELQSERWTVPRDWHFQYDIPVRHSQFTFRNDDWLDFMVLLQEGHLVTRKDDTFIANGIPAAREEKYVTTMEDYRGKLKFQLNRFDRGYGFEPFLSTWEKITNELYEDPDFGKMITKKGKTKKIWKLLEEDLDRIESKEEKIQFIYDFVLKNVSWNEFYGLYVEKDFNKIFEKGNASSQELNLLVVALLRRAGIACDPALVSPRNKGMMYEIYPILDQFKYVFAVVYADDGSLIFLDATDPDRPLGMLSSSLLNKKAFLVNEKNPRWISIEAKASKKIISMRLDFDKDFNISGSISCKYQGYASVSSRRKYRTLEDESRWEKIINTRYDDVEIDSFSFDQSSKITDEFWDKAYFSVEEAYDQSTLLYIPSCLFSDYTENPFKLEKRTYPIDFGYPLIEQTIMNVEIPEGYEIESVPESTSITLSDGSVKYKILSNVQGSKIQIVRKLNIRFPEIYPEHYSAIKTLFDLMIEKYKEPIILKRKT